jgi:signal transduction histidine kinase
LDDILTPLEQRWHARLAKDGRRLHVLVDDTTSVQSAPATLGQILDVLVDNATTHGRGTVTVTTTANRGSTSIDVEDEGAGLPTVPPGGDVRLGSDPTVHGLGMRLARSLAEAAGGRLIVRRRGPNPVIAVVLPAHARALTVAADSKRAPG